MGKERVTGEWGWDGWSGSIPEVKLRPEEQLGPMGRVLSRMSLGCSAQPAGEVEEERGQRVGQVKGHWALFCFFFLTVLFIYSFL